VGCGKGWTKEDRELRRSIQGDCGEAEQFAGVQVKDVAAALDIHPFMLSLWRKQVGCAMRAFQRGTIETLIWLNAVKGERLRRGSHNHELDANQAPTGNAAVVEVTTVDQADTNEPATLLLNKESHGCYRDKSRPTCH
jgi:hypothetical protein